MAPSRSSAAAAAALALLGVHVATAFRLPGCEFNVNGGKLPNPEPLFLQPNGPLDVTGYLQPDGSGNVVLATGDKILVACPGKKVASLGAEVTATCKTGTTFVVNGSDYSLAELACSAHPDHVAARTDERCGAGGRGVVGRIGHRTQRGLVVLIEVCFLDKTLEALYASALVTGNIGGEETGVARPAYFIGGADFYGSVDPDSHYKRGGQQTAFAKLLGSQELALEYISNTTDYYLARGHFAAKADFVWAQPQRATFYFVNVAPQWQTFNGGNWERLESSVRRLAAARGRDLLVVTGAWGRARLADAGARPVDLFVHADGLIPVPALYWKVVYDASTGEGAAFVGVNNPYTTLAGEARLALCPDVCAAVAWVAWAPASVKAGEGYCCEVDALRRAVPDVPPLKVSQLLAVA